MGAHGTVRRCRQHLAPKMCQRASDDLQLIPLITVSVGETGAMRPDSGATGPLVAAVTAIDLKSAKLT